MPEYSTKQRTLLLDFLGTHADETFCVDFICSRLGSQGVSKSAVYRNLRLWRRRARFSV